MKITLPFIFIFLFVINAVAKLIEINLEKNWKFSKGDFTDEGNIKLEVEGKGLKQAKTAIVSRKSEL